MIPRFTHPCIVPNARMVDKTEANTGRVYLSFLENSIEYLIRLGYQPIILIHESNDILIARNLQKRFGEKVLLIQESNPIILKGILGSSLIVIGSRYHALVGSLSQCVPTLGTSWSHKYQMLFEDYDCVENLISLVDETDVVTREIDRLLDESTRQSYIERLTIASKKQKDLTLKMWGEIQELLQV
jgi:polysaccharide pyruvyl transferase WcaK-like protein